MIKIKLVEKIKEIKKDNDEEIFLRTEGDFVNITPVVDKINEIIKTLNLLSEALNNLNKK